jgi:E3 ubiquitin-protein ligase TRAF7
VVLNFLIYIYFHLYRGHNDVVWSLTADRYKVFSSGSDSTIKIWDMENLAKGCIRTLEGHTGSMGM